jgi:peroxiredoxin
MLVPQQKVPSLVVDTVTRERFDLSSEQSEFATLICFYRGLHCPICATYLKELERLTPEFVKQGVSTIGVSSDTLERASALREKIGAEKLRIGYGLSISDARKWGLYISAGIGKTRIDIEEPEFFSEPAVYLIKPDQTLYYASVQSMPFVRPNFSELLQATIYVKSKNYPARGEYTGEA